jgi:hypothetical protein
MTPDAPQLERVVLEREDYEPLDEERWETDGPCLHSWVWSGDPLAANLAAKRIDASRHWSEDRRRLAK